MNKIVIICVMPFFSSAVFAEEAKGVQCNEEKSIEVTKANSFVKEYCAKNKHGCEFKAHPTSGSAFPEGGWTVIANPVVLNSVGEKTFMFHEERIVNLSKDCIVIKISGYHKQYYP